MNHNGPDQPDAFVIPAFAVQIACVKAGKLQPVTLVGNIAVEQDLPDVRDVARVCSLAIKRVGTLIPGEGLNLACGVRRWIGYILMEMIAQSGMDIAVETDPVGLRPVDIQVTSGDARAATQLLGHRPEIDFSTMLRDAIANSVKPPAIARKGR
ncbi:GDP-mannose 4,6-dehydratase [Acidiphilium acidophilum]|uniref:GDP-mannose 4,6-dehydratase n=1 Tax=Acidiphilium acidophilum TaxID=76588 RepID=UPI002E8E75E5|nr:GDP-mannose 4,6-dehydratase [Acidiphilium acidophilum]